MPKIVDHEQYRKDLIAKSFDLFAEKGYAITMRQIAQGLGVSTGTLYHYFPSKEALFEQLVIQQANQDLLQVADELKQANTLTERIEAAFLYLEKNQDYFFKQMMIWMDFSQHQNREGKECSEVLRQVEENIYAAIVDLLGIDDPDLLHFICALVDGLIIGQIYGTPTSISRQGKLLAKMVTAYLKEDRSQELENSNH
ncbi:TetR/AcrR family transcriptional regulator [Leptolyngbya sp. NK1-12]|uniref:TetR/AcrR family transcriptional regulator n=1 Tax=Leptolyngbya sp. NK1-12 TaxID=2547451 RepID=A0AA96WX61_9CYAN|nr:TetR/AcrR family transcriptional regulator [Leptolyngbya sp. NK1-12]WNZ25857.1 TetR/AcrR family transcriptional regulator [Leptolyngbya sp. NK1-12]